MFKLVSNCAGVLNNNLMSIGAQGLYAPTFKYERSAQCIVCGDGVVLSADPRASLGALLEKMGVDPRLRLKAPSVRAESGHRGDATLYMRGVLESHYAANLQAALGELVEDGAVLLVTDPGVPGSVKIVLQFEGEG